MLHELTIALLTLAQVVVPDTKGTDGYVTVIAVDTMGGTIDGYVVEVIAGGAVVATAQASSALRLPYGSHSIRVKVGYSVLYRGQLVVDEAAKTVFVPARISGYGRDHPVVIRKPANPLCEGVMLIPVYGPRAEMRVVRFESGVARLSVPARGEYFVVITSRNGTCEAYRKVLPEGLP